MTQPHTLGGAEWKRTAQKVYSTHAFKKTALRYEQGITNRCKLFTLRVGDERQWSVNALLRLGYMASILADEMSF